MINLALAAVWLVFAVVLFAMPLLNPDAPRPTIPNTGISMGWFALVFFFYNVARWWTTRPRRQRRFVEEDADWKPREETSGEPDTRFSDKPPPRRDEDRPAG